MKFVAKLFYLKSNEKQKKKFINPYKYTLFVRIILKKSKQKKNISLSLQLHLVKIFRFISICVCFLCLLCIHSNGRFSEYFCLTFELIERMGNKIQYYGLVESMTKFVYGYTPWCNEIQGEYSWSLQDALKN